MRVAFRTADVWLWFPTAESEHTDCIWTLPSCQDRSRPSSFFLAGSLTLFLLICVSLHRSVLNGTIWLFFPLSSVQPAIPAFLHLILAPFSLFFPSHLISHLNFFSLNLSTQFSQNRFPPLSSPLLQLPAASCFCAQICNTWSDDTLNQVCVCACVCVRNEREKLFGNHFVSDLSKPCGSSMPCFSTCWSFWFSKLSVKTVIWAYGKLNASVTSCCLFSVEVCVSVLLNFFSPCLCNVTETDDYAEIVDEEDTYTMPSSKYLQPSPSQFIRTNLNLRCCICYPAAKES